VQVSTSNVYRGVGVLHGVPGGSVAAWSEALDIYWGDAANRSSSTVPFTWAAGDWLYCGNNPKRSTADVRCPLRSGRFGTGPKPTRDDRRDARYIGVGCREGCAMGSSENAG
jgi:hypothetical protein